MLLCSRRSGPQGLRCLNLLLASLVQREGPRHTSLPQAALAGTRRPSALVARTLASNRKASNPALPEKRESCFEFLADLPALLSDARQLPVATATPWRFISNLALRYQCGVDNDTRGLANHALPCHSAKGAHFIAPVRAHSLEQRLAKAVLARGMPISTQCFVEQLRQNPKVQCMIQGSCGQLHLATGRWRLLSRIVQKMELLRKSVSSNGANLRRILPGGSCSASFRKGQTLSCLGSSCLAKWHT